MCKSIVIRKGESGFAVILQKQVGDILTFYCKDFSEAVSVTAQYFDVPMKQKGPAAPVEKKEEKKLEVEK